jgi:hypothetical protein
MKPFARNGAFNNAVESKNRKNGESLASQKALPLNTSATLP